MDDTRKADKVIFVSHQWTSFSHPDPKNQQLKALQMTIRNLLSGKNTVRTNWALEMGYGIKKVTGQKLTPTLTQPTAQALTLAQTIALPLSLPLVPLPLTRSRARRSGRSSSRTGTSGSTTFPSRSRSPPSRNKPQPYPKPTSLTLPIEP